MPNQPSAPSKTSGFIARCLSLDLEVGKRDARIHQLAAVKGNSGAAFTHQQGNLPAALARLDSFAAGMTFLLGHNLIDFDLPHLTAAKPDLNLLRLPAVDTLRLNPLAFPRNPYHHLVKHYQNGQLQRARINDPELDARLALEVFRDQCHAFESLQETDPDRLLAWHWLSTLGGQENGFDAFFIAVRRQPRPTEAKARQAIGRLLQDCACQTHCRTILDDAAAQAWALAYTLAWLSVAGGNSVMPPWVRHQFPQAAYMVKRLRDTTCDDPSCQWCRTRHDARQELHRWFPHITDFRPEPVDSNGVPLQRAIVEAALRGEHVLGILPTGTGKSICYQLPALSRFDKTGALTVVISPLVALMEDQVKGLEKQGINTCAAINGLLSMPERADILDRVRLGDVGILLIAPEQLRSKTLRKVLEQREIGAWVLDEAHCISKWGHDFRPDYRYVGRFIREKAGTEPIPPVLCLTATAKPEVVADIIAHFRDKLGIELRLFDGGASRHNLEFAVMPTTLAEKFAHVHQVLLQYLPPDQPGGAIVYCATRKQTEELAEYLQDKGIAADHFHSALKPERKKAVQESFLHGELRAITATNAFGMGIDKSDVRLVIHADIPGSLENYLQEAGRAGRDRATAHCVLLYTPEDVERQFSMSARSRLTRTEIQAILKSLRKLDRKKHSGGEVIATTGEILLEEEDGKFKRDSATDDTRVRTAIAWLEEAALLTREENQVRVFPSSLRISSIEQARERLAKHQLPEDYRRQLLAIVSTLIAADADEGVSTDELLGVSGLTTETVRKALYDLEQLGLASNDTALTAYVHKGHSGAELSSQQRLQAATELEIALLEAMREAAPDIGKGESSTLRLRAAAQTLKDAGHPDARPDRLGHIIRSLVNDGRGDDGGNGSVRVRRIDAETLEIHLLRNWPALLKTAELRRTAANHLLQHLLSTLPAGARGKDLLAETTLGKLLQALKEDLVLCAEVRDPSRLLDRALLWLHEQEVIRLNKGLAVFRPAMTIKLGQEKRKFITSDFTPLKLHYDEQVVQIHVMAEYVQRGLQAIAEALQLAMDYFTQSREAFLLRWLPDQNKEQLLRQTTPESWRRIVEELHNPIQQRIVSDEREQTNVLVLAGPGSGKTRVLVHRIAWLVRVKRENPHGVLALAYNRHAAVEIRQRLNALIGDDARGVTVLTCHALAMRLVGASFAERLGKRDEVGADVFRDILQQAVDLLNGNGLPPEEADEQRERLLAGFRWILVDEYQDIGPEQYELIAALAGRSLADEDSKLSLFAVGDDDQNIYAFDGASVEFIRRFEQDYKARPVFLTENYRSTAHIITAANLLIAPAAQRMKADNPITPDKKRSKYPPGGNWQARDSVGQGRVQILPAGNNPQEQALAVMTELRRLASLDSTWRWEQCAVIARNWRYLGPVRAYCEWQGIPVQMADEDNIPFWRLRETQTLVRWLRHEAGKLIDADVLRRQLEQQPASPWRQLLQEAVEAYALESGEAELPTAHCLDWLAEWGREIRRRQTGLLLLTAHRAKGLEFDHVAVLDGGWERISQNEDRDAARRLYYVAMTRARHTLLLARCGQGNPLLARLPDSPALLRREPAALPPPAPEIQRYYRRLQQHEVDLGYAGRMHAEQQVHRAIAALKAGDQLHLQEHNGKWLLQDQHGVTVGKLANAFQHPADMHCLEARVAAILVRRRDESEAHFQQQLRCEQWEVVLPELVFA